MIAGFKNIWISTNIKTTNKTNISWTKISSGLASVDNKNMHKVENSPANNTILYASRSDNKLFRTDNLTAGTVAWTDLTSSLPSSGIVEDIEADYTNQNIVYIIQNKKVYKSTNKGASWALMSTGLPNITMYDLKLDSSKTDGSLYVSGYAGVYYKNDNSSTWKAYFNNLPANVPVRDLEITYNTDASEYRLIAATYGRGTWQTQLYDNGVNKPEAEIDLGSSALCKGNKIVAYNISDYYPEVVSWTITPSTGVSFANGTSASSIDKVELSFANAGSYELKLYVENCNGKDSIIKIITIYDAPKTASCNSTTTNLNNNTGIGIWEFEINGFNNPSSGSVASGSNEDFTCLKINELKASTQYSVYTKTGNSNNESVSIYIDYDNNGTFSTAERVYTNTGAKTHSGNFTTPANAVTGKALRLRVISKFGALPTGPCQTFTYGQSEDYSIVILGDKADFTANKTSSCKSETIVFTDASTATGTYAWDFGTNASPPNANTKGPHNVTYSTTGNKTVKLTVKSTLVEEKTNFITINETPSISIAITKGGTINCEKAEVVLTATDSKSAAQSYEWYKGSTKLPETSNVLTIVSFASTDAGNYFAKGINETCTSNSSSIALSMASPVAATFTINKDKQCLKGNSFVLTSTSTGISLSHKWSFSNNTNSSMLSPTVAFSNAGAYTAKLVTTASNGCKDSITKSVTVDPKVNANFTSTNPSMNVFDFTPYVTTYSSFKWNFDNGNGSANTASASYDFKDTGTYDVKLVVQNETCKDTITKQVIAQFNSISEIGGFNNLTVSPNPSNGYIKLSFELSEAQELSFDLYNINGKLVANLDEPRNYNGINNRSFDLRKIGLANGTYFLNIVSKKGTNSIKLIIK
jgi:PKD repeat protein